MKNSVRMRINRMETENKHIKPTYEMKQLYFRLHNGTKRNETKHRKYKTFSVCDCIQYQQSEQKESEKQKRKKERKKIKINFLVSTAFSNGLFLLFFIHSIFEVFVTTLDPFAVDQTYFKIIFIFFFSNNLKVLI